jgi:molybdate transport system substrate-binding protein
MNSITRSWSAAALVLLGSVGAGLADEVRLISVGGVKDALDLIVADFQKATGHTVKFTAGSPVVVSQKLAAGEAFDLVVQSAPAMDEIAKLNGIKNETRVPVSRGGIGLAVHPNATAPDISTADGFKKALMSAKSIGIGDPSTPNGSGVVIQRILNAAGIANAIKPKIKIVGLDPGQQEIAKGDLEMGLMNASEVRSYLKFAGQVPAPLQDYTNYDMALTTKVGSTAATTALAQAIAGGAKHWQTARMETRSK